MSRRLDTKLPPAPALNSVNTYAERAYINKQGYDSQGRYYGTGEALFRLYTNMPGTWFRKDAWPRISKDVLEYRARNAPHARELAMADGWRLEA